MPDPAAELQILSLRDGAIYNGMQTPMMSVVNYKGKYLMGPSKCNVSSYHIEDTTIVHSNNNSDICNSGRIHAIRSPRLSGHYPAMWQNKEAFSSISMEKSTYESLFKW